MKNLYAIILPLLILGCSSQPPSNIIHIEIAPDKLLLEKQSISMNKFESELKFIVEGRVKQGIKKNDLTIELLIDNKTRRGDIVDLEAAMRRQNVRKILYASEDSDKQVLLRLD